MQSQSRGPAAAPDTRVMITHLHQPILLNRAAIRAAGLPRNTPEVPGGQIVRNAAGHRTGSRLGPIQAHESAPPIPIVGCQGSSGHTWPPVGTTLGRYWGLPTHWPLTNFSNASPPTSANYAAQTSRWRCIMCGLFKALQPMRSGPKPEWAKLMMPRKRKTRVVLSRLPFGHPARTSCPAG